MTKYVVKIDVSYIHMELMFDTSSEACAFMDLFCDHIIKRNDGKDVGVYMYRIDSEEVEEEAKGEE